MKETPDMTEGRRDFVCLILLCALCLVVYGRCATFEHTLYDDPNIIFENEHVQQGLTLESIRWAFTTPNFGLYMALPTLTFLIDRDLFGDWDGGYHLSTLFWHLLCVASFYLVMRRLTGAFAPVLAASLLVAVHPVQAMTINWISARNEIIPPVFMLWSIDFYRQGTLTGVSGFDRKRLRLYGASLLLMLLGLLSKQGIVLLPVVLLLLDYWPLQRITLQPDKPLQTLNRMLRLSLEKIPWFLLSVIGVGLAFYGKMNFGAFEDETLQSPLNNIGFSAVSFVRYLFHLVYPERYLMAYSAFQWTPAWWMVAGSVLLLGSITATAFYLLWRQPWMIVFWAWFVCFLLPVSGLVRYASESIALRYLYAPGMGIYLLVAFGLFSLIQRFLKPPRPSGKTPSNEKKSKAGKMGEVISQKEKVPPLFWSIVAVLTIACAAQAYRQSGFWRNAQSIAERSLVVSGGTNALAHNHLSVLFERQGQQAKYFAHSKAAFDLEPGRSAWRANYATALGRRGQYRECLEITEPLLKTLPDSVMANNLYGLALTGLGRYEEALPYLEKAVSIEPRYVPAQYNLGACLEQLGRLEEALSHYEQALAEQPGHSLSQQRRAIVQKQLELQRK